MLTVDIFSATEIKTIVLIITIARNVLHGDLSIIWPLLIMQSHNQIIPTDDASSTANATCIAKYVIKYNYSYRF